ncbi:MAG: allophanate hydrolase [Desulfovibrio sp.]|jgi:allophanate hydrolase|nr:allophanate hydrolase [Desulfovibrio sp.]
MTDFPVEPTFPAVRAWYAAGGAPSEAVSQILERIRAESPGGVWISLFSEKALLDAAKKLERAAKLLAPEERATRFPLYGFFFAVKDNIDVRGLETTAACPAYAYAPAKSAPVVELLLQAGALAVGKTNLDQFASGLVGTRSPYGACPNSHNPQYISGGSSAGSAYAVATGLVSFSLGTDTAGSNRVPAGFNNIIGLKPTRGVLSTEGVVPASRNLDCVGIFALQCSDAVEVYEILAGSGARESAGPCPRSSRLPRSDGDIRRGKPFVFGVPDKLEFYGDKEYQRLFDEGVQRLRDLGGRERRLPFAFFQETGNLLYAGPCLAERYAAFGEFLETHAGQVDPVVTAIVTGAKKFTAADAYRCQYRLRELRALTRPLWRELDMLFVPTAPTIYTIEQLRRDPFRLNANLGYYTNYVNLLDLSAIAVPSGFTRDNLPFGVTMLAGAFGEKRLLPLAEAYHKTANLPFGACRRQRRRECMEIAVVGAHMRGLALNHQITALGGTFSRTCRTAPRYRMFVLPGEPARPAILRTDDGCGRALEAEIWNLPMDNVGPFLSGIRPPLSLGTVILEDDKEVKGFLSETYPLASAKEITDLGGFRAYLGSAEQPGR